MAINFLQTALRCSLGSALQNVAKQRPLGGDLVLRLYQCAQSVRFRHCCYVNEREGCPTGKATVAGDNDEEDMKLGPYERCRGRRLPDNYRMPTRQECMLDPCPGYDEPLDVKNYRKADVFKRHYQQTWTECVPISMFMRRCKVVYPTIVRRKRKVLQEKKKAPTCNLDETMLPCRRVEVESKCPRVTMPGCPSARPTFSCKRLRTKDECRRRQTRYPSYSECKRDAPEPLPITECGCYRTPPMCVVYQEFARRKNWRIIAQCAGKAKY